MPFFLQTDWDEGPRGARSCAALRLARKQMWKRRKLSEVGLDPSEGRSDPLVTCKCRRTPRVNPGCGSTTTVRVCRCHLPPSTGRSTHRCSLNRAFLSLQYHLTTPHPSTSTTAASQSRPNGTPCATAVLLYSCITYLGSSHIDLHVSIPLSTSHSRPQHHFTASPAYRSILSTS